MSITDIIVGILFVVILVIGFLYLWVSNHKTEIPEGAFVEKPQCSGCSNTGCGNYKKPEE